MIPRILHQTSKTKTVSEKWAPLQKIVRDLHPDWEYRHWSDEDNDRLIREQYPELESIYFGLPKPIMRADLIRYVYMDRFGGLYLDTDYEFLKPFDLTDFPVILPNEAVGRIFLGNCVFASIPGHPFWKSVLSYFKGLSGQKVLLNQEDDIIQITGPGLLTRIYLEKFSSDKSICVPSKEKFHPPTPKTTKDYQSIVKNDQSYGIHYCFGSWRALTLRERLKARWEKIFRK